MNFVTFENGNMTSLLQFSMFSILNAPLSLFFIFEKLPNINQNWHKIIENWASWVERSIFKSRAVSQFVLFVSCALF